MKVKTTRTLSKVFKALLLFLLVTAIQTSRAQNPTYLAELRNDVAVDAQTYEFDIFLLRTGATPFEMAASQFGIYLGSSTITPAGGVLSASIVAGTSEMVPLQQPTSANISIANSSPNKTIKITGNAFPGAGAGTIISNVGFGTRFARIRVSCTLPFVANSHANLSWSFANPPSWPSKVQAYVAGLPVNITVTSSHTISNLLNPALNAPVGNPPAAFAVTGGGDYCSSVAGAPVGLSGSEIGVTYTLTPGGAIAVGTGLPVSFGLLPGPVTYTASGTANGTVGTIVGTTPMSGTAVVNAPTPSNTVDFTASACDTYTWALNGVTYTISGNYTYVVGCVTNVLHLTITPSSTVNETASACDTYTWAFNGVTYTASGDYTVVDGCVSHVLHLTITPSSTVNETASACDSYTWAFNGVTYTASGDYTVVDGCVSHVLHLTITPSSTVNETASACDSYTWAFNGVTYTASGDYTVVDGCVTHVLHLTITPSSTVNETASACDTYTWAFNGVTYTASGDYTVVDGCVSHVLHLTITPSSTVEFTVSAVGSYTWSLNSVTYTVSGDYTYVVGCVTNILHLTITAPPCLATTWTGLVDNDWFNAGNWNPCVPQATTDVTIAVAPNYPTLTGAATCASIVIESGASFIGAEFLTVGNAVVKQNFPLTGYHYISSPVSATTFNSVFPLNQNAVWAYLYDEPSGNWMNQFIADPLGVGVGYSVRMDVPQTATFAGALNASPVQKDLSLMNTSGIPYRAGWNLFGNPFQSAIDWDMVTLLGADAAVYVWNGSVYKSYVQNLTGDPGFEDGIIPSMNGFFVHSNTPGTSIIVGLQARTHNNKPFFKEGVSNMLSLRADANNYSDGAVVSFNDNATAGFDSQFDAYKLTGIEQAPKLYSMISGDILSINSLPMQGNEVVNLGFKCGVNGTYSITSTGMASFDATTPILLEDLKTGTVQDLRISPSYSFDYNTADNENRFKLHFKSANSVPTNSLSGINIYSAVRTIVINNTTTLAGEVKIYDLTGRELMHTGMSSQNITNIPVNFAVGTYLVKVITEKGVASNKVFIR